LTIVYIYFVDYNMCLQTTVLEAAECNPVVFSSAQFVFGALRELSVLLCKWNHQQDCAVAGFLRGLQAAASSVVHLIRPSAEVGDEVGKCCLFRYPLPPGLPPVVPLLSSGSLCAPTVNNFATWGTHLYIVACPMKE
jgi:hypothetical protein